MKIGIIIHSVTGNTLSVGEKIREALIAKGFETALERVIAADEKNPGPNPALLNKPETQPYDMIIFGAPVHGFTLSRAMQAYMSQLSGLENKKVRCFVTQQLTKPWLGGNRAIRKMTQLCSGCGVGVGETGIVHWSSRQREEQIGDLAEVMSNKLQ